MINANKTYEDIVEKNIDDNVCANLPVDAQDSCRNIVDQQIPAIWSSIITEYLDPSETCTSAHLCPAIVHSNDFGSVGADPVTCHICKKTAQFIDLSIFEDPIVQKKVAKKLKQICSQLPGGNVTENQCDKLIDNDIADVMSEIGKAVAANMCADLELCSTNQLPSFSPVCHRCENVMSKMKTLVSGPEPYYLDAFRTSVQNSICKHMDAAENSCVVAAGEVAASAWSAVAMPLLDPSKACLSAGFCGSSTDFTGDALPCHVCKKLATFIDTDILEDPAVQRDVASKLKEICSQLPNPRIGNSSVTVQCEKLIDDNTADIMGQIGQVVEARLCEDLAVC